jgi:DNA-binding MarR family transcriptional regulator
MPTSADPTWLLPVADQAETVDLGPLPSLVGYLARRAQLTIFEDFNRTLSQLDLSPGAFAALLVAHRNPGLRQRRMGEALGIQPPNMAVLAAGLCSRGLLQQRPHPSDKRAVALHITPAGRALLEQAERLVAAHDQRVTRALNQAERAELLRLLGKLNP